MQVASPAPPREAISVARATVDRAIDRRQARERGKRIARAAMNAPDGRLVLTVPLLKSFLIDQSPRSMPDPCLGLSADKPRMRARSPRRPSAQAARSSAKSGDSGSGDDDSDPEPALRCCQNPACGAPLPPSSRSDHKYCDAACRQELHRHPDNPKKPNQADKYLRSTQAVSWAWELEALQVRAAEGCRCNGSHVAAADGSCVKCGRVRDRLLWEREASEPSYVRALSAERDHEREFQVAAS